MKYLHLDGNLNLNSDVFLHILKQTGKNCLETIILQKKLRNDELNILNTIIRNQKSLISIKLCQQMPNISFTETFKAIEIMKASKLQCLDFTNCNLNSETANLIPKIIEKHRQITSLYLHYNKIESTIGKKIFDTIKTFCENLKIIAFDDCEIDSKVGNIIGEAIGQQKELEQLLLNGNKIGSNVSQQIFKMIKQNCFKLSAINFDNCEITCNVGNIGDAFENLTSLTTLTMQNNNLGSKVGGNIFKNIQKKCVNLIHLCFDNCKFDQEMGDVLGNTIAKQKNLNALALSNNQLGSKVGRNIFKNIQNKCFNLIHLCFDNCKFDQEIGDVVGFAIANQKKLNTLVLSNNQLGSKVGKHIFENIKNNCFNLCTLAFDNCNLTEYVGNEVGDAIGKQKNISLLTMQMNNLGSSVGKCIFENISQNCRNLTRISFGNCGFNSNITNIIGEAIGKQKSLQYLYLQNNNLGTECCRNIFQNIYQNCSNLKHINLGNCGFDFEIGNIIGDAIGKQKGVESLVFDNNNLGTEIGRYIFEQILNNNCTSLINITMCNCEISDVIRPIVAEVMERQKYLKFCALQKVPVEQCKEFFNYVEF
ncbi:unnamed protein product [Dimorphilus gyrociliatus]|uniref:Uncharacterized protein n=1 Tax=Dimorphilus gyrociliatus TaxID=2664684 RepID=A0A7I8WEW8_9ANNE|nr:unnamed protein product [Dimorphilus gyrociliatus]